MIVKKPEGGKRINKEENFILIEALTSLGER
jgi:hypothetical protein